MTAYAPLPIEPASSVAHLLHAIFVNVTTPLTGGLCVVGFLLLYAAHRSSRLRSWLGRAAMILCGSLGLLFVGASQFGLPFAYNNAMLGALPSTQFSAVTRLGFYTPGDALPLTYIPSGSPCSLNAGAGDNGSQVRSLDYKCWLAVFPTSGVDPRQFGAKGDQATDDYAAIQAAVNYVGASGAGIVRFSAGNYCVKAAGISVTTPGIRIVGATDIEVQTCGADVTPFTLNARRDSIEHLTIAGCCFGSGSAGITTAHFAINEQQNCTECRLDDLIVVGGSTVIYMQAQDNTINNVVASQGYGAAILSAMGTSSAAAGTYCNRCKFDQNWPLGPPSYGTMLNAWAMCTTYAIGTVVSTTGGFYIQNMNGGKSGATAPALANYNQTINDNAGTCSGSAPNAQWQLVGPIGYRSVYLGSYVSVYWESNSDHSGPFNYAVDASSGGSNGPYSLMLVDSFCGQTLSGCFNAHDGGDLMIRGGIWSNCILTNCQGLYTSATWNGDTSMLGVTMFGLGYAVLDSTGQCFSGGSPAVCSTTTTVKGTGLDVEHNIVGSSHGAALYAGAITNGVIGFNYSNNILNSAIWGSNTIGVQVANGAADYYSIINNFCGGASNCVNDGGTGTHKTVSGNY